MKITKLEYRRRHKIMDGKRRIKELSGLTVDEDGRFWTVSDSEETLFRLNRKFKLEKKVSPKPKLIQLEGIAAGPSKIGAVSEPGRFITLDIDTGKRKRFSKDLSDWIPAKESEKGRKGIEGVCWRAADRKRDRAWVFVTESPSHVLLLRLDRSVERLAKLNRRPGFKSSDDCSGIYWDARRRVFWICSDRGKRIYLFDPKKRKLKSLKLRYKSKGDKIAVEKAEGVAVVGDRLFIAYDEERKNKKNKAHYNFIYEYAIK